ncbi:MAG TPA: hypothetical protein VFT12_06280 [Thermoanaerobaculia bacterium]|nr:hypothetical protein [Thermoanaerobaculia bacterium]
MRIAFALAVLSVALGIEAQTFRLESTSGLELHNVAAEVGTHRGRRAVRLVESERADGPAIAILEGSTFRNGIIEAEIAGVPRAGAPEGSRGFVGIAFRTGAGGSKYECFYLRPTNARADDQLRRNHSTQYVSHPDWPWHRLRKEHPGVYESYADMEAGAWTRVKIVVSGTRAQLYVNGAEQPALIVNDLKLGDTSGAVALWIGSGTEAWFSNLRLRASPPAE